MDSPIKQKLGSPLTDEIHILPVTLLDEHQQQVEALKRLARSLGIGLGWHYLLDWTWILEKLGDVRGKRVLDAGAGEGLLQWYLAGQGAEVISVDRSSRAELSLRFRARYPVSGLTEVDLASPVRVARKNFKAAQSTKNKAVTLIRSSAGVVKSVLPKSELGKVVIYTQDLSSMPLIPENSIDAVVAVSALEHNSPSGLSKVVIELFRVLKPGGIILATLGAARDQDWFHEPSKGWCYTATSLCNYFDLPTSMPTNYADYDALMSALISCSELRDNLASFYFTSGNNGMPWGKWDPQYQPVGVCKIK